MKAIALAASLALAACADQQPANTSAIDSAGVEIVTYTGDDQMLEWAADTVVVLGGANVEPSDSAFYSVMAVEADADGNIYVLDESEGRVLVYDSTGAFVRRFGAKGGGPGEFEMPLGLSVSPDGLVSVFDRAKRTLVRFDHNGATLDQIRIDRSSFTGAFFAHGDVVVHAVRELDDDGGSERLALVRVADSQVTELLTADRRMGDLIHLESCGIRFRGLAPIFAPSVVWDAQRVRIAGVLDPQYNVHTFTGDSLIRLIRRSLPPLPATSERAVASLGAGMRVGLPTGERVCANEEVVEKRGFAEVVPLVADLMIAPDSSIWISRNTDEHGQTLTDIFDSSYNYVGTLSTDYPFPHAFVSRRTIVVRDEDEMGVAQVLVIRLTTASDT